jgi:hypothetical protein
MAVVSTRLPEALQSLVDARLDTIDRMLLGRVSRGDRLAIVREVEAQVFELLAEREELDRDTVLAVLARLDPPEAYLPDPDDADGPLPMASMMARRPGPVWRGSEPPRGWSEDRFARASGVIGILAFFALMATPLVYLMALALQSEFILFVGGIGAALLAIAGGFVAVTLAVFVRFRSGWAVAGAVAGAMTLLMTVTFGGYLMLIQLNS